MSYNIEFDVKYYNIEKELIENKNSIDLESETKAYDIEDIHCICDKLYMDELSSVFYAENVLDDNIDKGIEYISLLMLQNEDFLKVINDIKHILMLNNNNISNRNEDYDSNANYIIVLASFNYCVFHIMHKCIVEQLTTGKINNELLVQLKNALSSFIINK